MFNIKPVIADKISVFRDLDILCPEDARQIMEFLHDPTLTDPKRLNHFFNYREITITEVIKFMILETIERLAQQLKIQEKTGGCKPVQRLYKKEIFKGRKRLEEIKCIS